MEKRAVIEEGRTPREDKPQGQKQATDATAKLETDAGWRLIEKAAKETGK
jgi:hypothetical protein